MNQIDQKLRVGFLLLDNFTLNAFSGFIEALRLAADQGGRSQQIACGWQMMSQGRVTASCGLSVAATRYLSDPSEMDYLAVCGGNDYHSRTQPAWLDSYLRRAAEADTRLIGICTGTFNIARSGLMKNRPACVHWNVINEFRSQFPRIEVVADRIFIDAGDRITCAGSAGAADLALHLITRHCGREKALQSIRHMLLTGVRPSTHPQAHFKIQMESVADECVRRCVNLMEQALNDPPAIPYLAQEVGLSPRQLDRRFTKAVGKPPGRYFREMRLRYGSWLLTHTTDTVAQIAADTGFSDAAHFHREFRKQYGRSPKQYRQSVSASAVDIEADLKALV